MNSMNKRFGTLIRPIIPLHANLGRNSLKLMTRAGRHLKRQQLENLTNYEMICTDILFSIEIREKVTKDKKNFYLRLLGTVSTIYGIYGTLSKNIYDYYNKTKVNATKRFIPESSAD